jgi:prepilin-type processing-associated H-X9-DG protein
MSRVPQSNPSGNKFEGGVRVPGGVNVLCMDGHVQFLRYGQCEAAPCNEPMAVMIGLLTSG